MSGDEIPLMRELLYEMGRAFPHVRAFRRNVLKLKMIDTRTQKERMVIAGIPGQCDLYCYLYGGRVVEIELKAKNGRLSPEQRTWRDWCQAGQIPWLCLWPWPGETREETVKRWVSVIGLIVGPIHGTLSVPVVVPEQTVQTSVSVKRPKVRSNPIRSKPNGPRPV